MVSVHSPAISRLPEKHAGLPHLNDTEYSMLAGDPEMAELAKEEIEQQNAELVRLTGQLKLLLLPKDPLDEKNIMLEVWTTRLPRLITGDSSGRRPQIAGA